MHGPIEFDGANIEDFVILRSDGQPTYQLSVVSDDVEMEITHVVRGDDHISNTPKQMLLYQAIGAPVPQFAHVPLILGPDKKRLSKRHGATSVTEYARQGYLPEAMVNFLALLGWSPGSDQELFTRDELVERVRARRASAAATPCSTRRSSTGSTSSTSCGWRRTSSRSRLKPLLEAAGLWHDDYLGDRHAWFFAVLELLRPRAKRLDDFAAQGALFFARCDRVRRGGGRQASARRQAWTRISTRSTRRLPRWTTFDPASTEAALRALAEARGVKAGVLIHAVRVAVTGKTVSPGLFDVLALLGRDRVRARLDGRAPASADLDFLIAPFVFPPLTR